MTTEADGPRPALRRSARRRRPPIVRIERSERLRISRALDLGRRRPRSSRASSRPTTSARRSRLDALPAGRASAASPSAAAGRASARSVTRTSARVNDVVVGVSRSRTRRPSPMRTRSRRCRAPTSCSSGRPTCRTSLGVPGRFDDPTLPRRDRCRRSPHAGARQGGRHPALRRGGARAPPRARVPVHRPRLGGFVRGARGMQARCWPRRRRPEPGRAGPRPTRPRARTAGAGRPTAPLARSGRAARRR